MVLNLSCWLLLLLELFAVWISNTVGSNQEIWLSTLCPEAVFPLGKVFVSPHVCGTSFLPSHGQQSLWLLCLTCLYLVCIRKISSPAPLIWCSSDKICSFSHSLPFRCLFVSPRWVTGLRSGVSIPVCGAACLGLSGAEEPLIPHPVFSSTLFRQCRVGLSFLITCCVCQDRGSRLFLIILLLGTER